MTDCRTAFSKPDITPRLLLYDNGVTPRLYIFDFQVPFFIVMFWTVGRKACRCKDVH